MLKQLRRKFILITMSLVLVMLTVIFSLVYSFTKAGLDAEIDDSMSKLSTISISPGGISQMNPMQVKTPWIILQSLGNGYVQAFGYTGYDLNDEAFLQDLLHQVRRQEKQSGTLDSYQFRYQQLSGDRILFLDISGYRASLQTLIESCILIGSLSLIAFWVISFFLARWAVKPVEQAWEQQRQFVSDASHELKTPLTVIMSNAELLQEEKQEDEQGGRYAQNIMTMSYQMKDLVEGLLELARVDNGQVKKSFEPMDMSALIQETLLVFEPVLYEKGLHLRAKVQPGIHLSGSVRYLKQVVDILLDNAGKYSDPGVVDVAFVKQGKSCFLTVTNPGTPIPAQERKKIFERFYRSDQARSRTGSFGLGLSIAQSVVQEHGGKIWVASNTTGNCFCVQLPCE